MPRRKKLPVAAPLAFRPTTLRLPQLIPFGLPELDAALGGGLPVGRLTEIIGATAPAGASYGSTLLAAQFIANRQKLSPHASALWTDLSGSLDFELLRRAGVNLDLVTVLRPRDGAEALNRAFSHLITKPSHVLVISGLPKLGRRDLLFIGLLERLALLIPGTRTVLVCLSKPASTGPALARLAAVRLALDNEEMISERGRTILAADLTVLKHRFAKRQPGWRPGKQIALRISARLPRSMY